MCKSALYGLLWAFVWWAMATGQVSVTLRRKVQDGRRTQAAPGGLSYLADKVPQHIVNYRNVYYYGEVSMGTPGDRLNVLFDTGSPSLWVYSGSGVKSWMCITCWFHRTYHHGRSSTYEPDGTEMSITYASGYMRGFKSVDILRIGKLATRVEFGEATSTPISTISEKFDGILGLGPCSGPTCPVLTDITRPVIREILTQLPQPIFSVYLDRTEEGGGEITFGGLNQDLFVNGSLMMYPTVSPYIWSIRIQSIWIGSRLVVDCHFGCMAVVDTGTTYILGPTIDVDTIQQLAGINKDLTVDCNMIDELPSITFVIGTRNYTFQGKDYAPLSNIPPFGKKTCYAGLDSLDLGTRVWVLGEVFLRKVYTVFEMDRKGAKNIGFALLKK